MSALVTFHGASGRLSEKLIAAHNAGLRVREITHGSNGYREPFYGEFFVSGFDRFVDAELFAEANGGEVGDANSKSGWGCVDRFAPRNGPLTILGDLGRMLGDNHRIEIVAEEKKRLSRDIADAIELDDEVEANRLKQQLAALADLDDAKLIHLDCGEIMETFASDEAMSIDYDMTSIEVGVRLTDAD